MGLCLGARSCCSSQRIHNNDLDRVRAAEIKIPLRSLSVLVTTVIRIMCTCVKWAEKAHVWQH